MKLQQMIDLVLQGTQDRAMMKLAQESEGESEGEGPTEEETMSEEEKKRRAELQAQKEESQQGGGEATVSPETSNERVSKMASAVEEIVQILTGGRSRSPVGRVALAQDPTAIPTDEGELAPEQAMLNFGQAREQIPLVMPTESVYGEPGTAVETDIDDPEPPEGPGPEKTSALKMEAVRRLIQKRASALTPQQRALLKLKAAGEDVSQASISAPTTNELPESRPLTEPLNPGSEQLRALLQSNESVMGITPKQTKQLPREQLKDFLSEPALSRATDKTLDETLGADMVNQAGAKIASARKLKVAAARALISKISSEGCTCSKSGLKTGECRFCKVSSRIRGGSKCGEWDNPFGTGPSAGGSSPQMM